MPGPAEVWGLARAETNAVVGVDKADSLDGVVVAARAVVKGRAALLGVAQTGEMNYSTF